MAWRSKEDPHEVFSEWLEEAKKDLAGAYKTAFTLCTTSADGEPNGRTVLLRDHTLKDEKDNFVLVWLAPDIGVKAKEIEDTHKATAVFLWSSKDWVHQVHVKGTVSKGSMEISEKYFKELPRQFQVGTWSSEQDQPIPSVEILDKRYEENDKKFPVDSPVPRPSSYIAYLLHPLSYEFYDGGDIMIHNLRAKYTLTNNQTSNNGKWEKTLLAP